MKREWLKGVVKKNERRLEKGAARWKIGRISATKGGRGLRLVGGVSRRWVRCMQKGLFKINVVVVYWKKGSSLLKSVWGLLERVLFIEKGPYLFKRSLAY